MAPALRAFHRNSFLTAGLLAAGACALAQPAPAAGRWLHDAFGRFHGQEGRHGEAPEVAKYAIDDGGDFVFDRSARQPLLKFDDSPEIWALSPSRGPRGDMIYKNDLGEPMLRATNLGGLTVFTPRRPGGSAAAVAGASAALRLAPIGPLALYQRLVQVSVRSSRAAQHLIEIDAPDFGPASEGVLADSALVCMQAMVALSLRPDGKPYLARVSKIAFRVGKKPEVTFGGGVIHIDLTPAEGIAGRPSSRRILWAMGVSNP